MEYTFENIIENHTIDVIFAGEGIEYDANACNAFHSVKILNIEDPPNLVRIADLLVEDLPI